MRRARVEVPATSANLGPGFDALGLALAITDTLTVEVTDGNDEVRLAGVTGSDERIDEFDNLVCGAYHSWQRDAGVDLPGIRFDLECRIPMARGLGSSAAAIVAGLAAAAFAAEDQDPRDRMLRLAVDLEGHPDNVVPAILGGLTVTFVDDGGVHAMNVVNHLELAVVLFIPDDPVPTRAARTVLPSSVPLRDAARNIARAAYLVTALQWGRWEDIGPAMDDDLHQPYRRSLVPGLPGMIESARAAGAYGAALSGAGPSVIALCPTEAGADVSAAMQRRADEDGWRGRTETTAMRDRGVTVTPLDEPRT